MRRRRWIGIEIVADFVCAAANAIIRARNCVHKRRIVADNCAAEIIDLWDDRDLAAMWFEIDILNKFACADTRAIDHQIKGWADVFEFFEFNVTMDLAAGLDESVDP